MRSLNQISRSDYINVEAPAATVTMTLPQSRANKATINGVEKRMPPQNHRVLELLLMRQHPIKAIPMVDFIEYLWPDPDFEADFASQIVQIKICELRALGVPIENRWGYGYRLSLEAPWNTKDGRGLTSVRAKPPACNRIAC
jgi:DNA-binding response OmpR family regulator